MNKRIFASILIFSFIVAATVAAQQPGSTGLVVRTTPPGAEVMLEGEAVVTGISPTFFQQQLIGEYKVKVKKYGYENYSTKVILDPTKQMEIAIKLSPKTRFKAAARSLFIPGWGQRYADEKLKGYAFTVLAAGAITGYLIANEDFNDKYDTYESRLDTFDEARRSGASYAELRTLQQQLADAQSTAYDAENLRRIMIGTVIGVWALNLVDALFFFPSDGATFSVKGLSVSPSADGKTFGLTLTHGF